MKYWREVTAVILLATITLTAPAGPIFGKHNKVNPAERVPQLISVVKTSKDDDKRADAAKELREYDPNAYPDVVPVLIDVLQHDAKPYVRAEAAQSLSKLRPISQNVGWALAYNAAAVPLAFVREWIADLLFVGVALVWLVPDRRIERGLEKE